MKFFNAIIFSNIWISIGAIGTTTAFYRFIGQEINFYYLTLVFFATLFAYNFQYISEQTSNDDRQKQTSWITLNLKFIKILTITSFFICVFLSLYIFTPLLLLVSSPVFLLVFFYKKGTFNKLSLRNIPLAKIIIIAFCWMCSCSIIPGLISNELISVKMSLYIFLYVIAITLPFDIRDYHFDNESIITIPHLFGAKATYFLSIIILFFLFIMSLENYGLLLFISISLIIILPSYKLRSEYYYLFILDGLLLVFPIFVK